MADVSFKLEWVFLRLMILEYGFIKLSVIFFYRRIFVTNRWSVFDIITKISTVIIVMWTTGFFLANVFGCGMSKYGSQPCFSYDASACRLYH